jgi:hypothetical protein
MGPGLVLALLVAAATPTSPSATPATAVPATADPDAVTVPAGAPADVALWRRTYDLNNEIPIERSISTRLQLEVKNGRLLEGLAALRKRPGVDHDTHERAEHAEERLVRALREDVQVLTAQWPVDPTRVCAYDLLNFESVLRSDENPRKAAQLAQTREPVQECAGKAELALSTLRGANDRLREAITVAEQALPRGEEPAATTR